MRIWFDTEFLDDGRTIELISIGMIREDGRTYYAESSNYDQARSTKWLIDNVHPGLKGGEALKPRSQIAKEIIEFVGNAPEFWAYVASYDWVVLCQLYGSLTNRPNGWPIAVRDLHMLSKMTGVSVERVEIGTAHNALDDASACRMMHYLLLDAWNGKYPKENAE